MLMVILASRVSLSLPVLPSGPKQYRADFSVLVQSRECLKASPTPRCCFTRLKFLRRLPRRGRLGLSLMGRSGSAREGGGPRDEEWGAGREISLEKNP